MNLKSILILAVISITSINGTNASDAVTMEQYQETENLLYARRTEQSNVANYYRCGVQKLYDLYKKCKETAPTDSTPCAKVTLALARVLHEQTALSYDEENNIVYELPPHRVKSFELFEEVTNSYPDCKDPNVLALALFYQADNARWGMSKDQDYELSIALYNDVINNPEVTDQNVIAWAKGRLGDSYREGQGVEVDLVKSAQYFQDILDNANNISDKSIVAWAEYWIADAYEHGKGCEKDTEKAAQMFSQITQTYVKTDPIAVIYARERAESLKNQL